MHVNSGGAASEDDNGGTIDWSLKGGSNYGTQSWSGRDGDGGDFRWF
jgi:hypothetical protein